METIVHELLGPMLGAGPQGFIALLMLLTGGMGWFLFKRESETKTERRELIDQFQKTIDTDRKDLLEVIDKYQEGQISVIQALTELRVLIATLGAKV